MSGKCVVLAVAVVLSGLAAGPRANAQDPDLVGWWKFDEGAGSTAQDSSGKGHNGTLQGAPQWVAGQFDGALAFNGSNYVQIAYTADLALNDFTICAWVNLAAEPVESGILGTRSGGEYTFDFKAEATQIHGDIGTGTAWLNTTLDIVAGDTGTNKVQGGDLELGTWYLVAYVIDNGKQQVRLYVDGDLKKTISISGKPLLMQSGETMRIGHTGYGTEGMNGLMDDVRIYSRALSTSEIKALVPPKLKAYRPDPADGAIGVTLPLLQWTKGDTAVFHNVYLGTSPELTEADLQPRGYGTMLYYIPGLTPGVKYYWRVDEVEGSGTIYTGDVWSFTAMPLTAYLPQPADDAVNMVLTPTLSWAAGQTATAHHVYFGTDRQAVEAGTGDTDKGTTEAGATSYKITDELKPDSSYFWRVDETGSGGTVHTGPVWSFSTVWPGPTGAIRQWWSNIGSGTAVTDLTGNPNYPENPTGSEFRTLMEGPVDWADNYGTRLYGWVYPPRSGDYTFWIASDDASELWLSTDEDPANAVVIASVTGWMPSRDFDGTGGGVPGTTFKSNPVTLAAGQRYYIEALQKEGAGGDNVAVAWQGPGFTREVLGAGGVGPTPYLPQKAYEPSPADGAVDTVQSLTLTWSAGEKALQHELYLGDDANAVAAADSSSDLFKGSLSNASYDTGELEWGKTFFWRVDEINTGEAESPWVGHVWSFSTANFIPVEDFESYNDVEGTDTRIYETWIDGYTDGLSGSVVGNFDPPFAERTIVHGGAQSMPMDYDNSSSPFYSQAYREFSPVMNWTGNGVTDLSLWVRGWSAPIADVTENAGQMTVSGEGSDIWNNSDQFTFVYKTLNGDGSLVARVVSNGTGSNTWAKGGMMIRATLDAGSPHAIMAITGDTAAGAGASFQYRLDPDGTSANNDNAGTAVAPPYWVKIERTGDSIAGYMSADGTNWGTALGIQYIAMTSPAYIGIAVSSHAAGEYRTFEFDNIKATGAGGSWQTKEIGLMRNSQQPLYVIVEDSSGKQATLVDPNAAAVNATTWTEWKIPLTDLAPVNLSKVQRLSIGVGDPDNPAADGTGRIYLDDIRVVKP